MKPLVSVTWSCAAVLLLALLFCCCHGNAKKLQALPLPNYIGQGCRYNDPNLNECVVKKGAPAIKKLAQGDPKYKIPRLDPFTIEEIRIQQGTKQFGITIMCWNCSIHGLQDIRFVKARVDLDNSHCEWDFEVDQLQILGKYNVSGQVLVVPISGSGNANITLTGIKFSYIYDWILEKRENGLEYVVVTNGSLPYQITQMYIYLDNLFNGDRLLRDNMNLFLNENWKDILKELGPAFTDALSEVFKNTLTAMADVVPFNNLFPKD